MSTHIAVVSGGMDSVTLAHYLVDNFDPDLIVLSVDYGQRHVKEIEFARECADRLGGRFLHLDLSTLGSALAGSALTDSTVDVPEGHYAEPTMAATVVPNRNAILLSLAYGVAVSEGASSIATAVHAGDHPVYPDCRPKFVEAFAKMEKIATEGHAKSYLRLRTPFVNIDKAQIARLGKDLGVPFERTWSCYKGGRIHCGVCSTCVERLEAFDLAGVDDKTEYEDADYWRTVV